MNNFEKAVSLHRKWPSVDAHLDLAPEVFYRRKDGMCAVIEKIYLDNWKKSGFKLIVSFLFADLDYPSALLRQTLEQIAAIKKDIEESKDKLVLVTGKKQLEEVLSSEKIGIMLSFEGMEAIENNPELLDIFYELGVRGAGLVWSRRNFIADGCISEKYPQGTHGGLTEIGVAAVEKMDRLKMFFDVSHLNDIGFWDLMKFSRGPVIASHTDCRGVYPTNRNLSDEQIKAITERGGVIGINAIKHILGVEDEAERINKLCDHIDHIVSLVGTDHVGFGFDLCNNCMDVLRKADTPKSDYDALYDHSEAVLITEELIARGYGEEDLRKIIGGNFLRIYETVLK